MTVCVWGRAIVVVVVAPGTVLVVAASGQLPAAQLSQQLGMVPTHAEPPLGAVHLAAFGFTTHFVLPLAVVRQQVTNPALPQVDFLAHPNTAARNAFGRSPLSTAALATWATQ